MFSSPYTSSLDNNPQAMTTNAISPVEIVAARHLRLNVLVARVHTAIPWQSGH